MQNIIYKLLYFTEIGEKIRISPKDAEKLWKNLEIYRHALKRTKRVFRMETFENYTLIWRTK
jgi:hypothetical protein